MEIRPLQKRRPLVDEIVEVLTTRMTSGDLKLGDQLPTEHQLADAFQVSRSVVREALARLKQQGLVRTQQGRGVFVDSEDWERPTAFSGIALSYTRSQIVELRLAVEPAAARMAAWNRSETELSAIWSAVTELDNAQDHADGGAAADMSFHRAVARASANPLFVSVLDMIHTQMETVLAEAHVNTRRVTGGTGAVQLEHQAIYEAIAAKDGTRAYNAMAKHITRAASRLSISLRTK